MNDLFSEFENCVLMYDMAKRPLTDEKKNGTQFRISVLSVSILDLFQPLI